MKVLFDHDLFYQPIGGTSKYFVMLLKYMPKELWATTPLLSCNEHPCMKDFLNIMGCGGLKWKVLYRFLQLIKE